MINKIIIKPNGLTIKELKEIIKNMPDNDNNGEPYEVWIHTSKGLSSPVKEISPLNKSEHGSDIIFGVDYE